MGKKCGGYGRIMGVLYELNKAGTEPVTFAYLCTKCERKTKHNFCYLSNDEGQTWYAIETRCLRCGKTKEWPLKFGTIFSRLVKEEE